MDSIGTALLSGGNDLFAICLHVETVGTQASAFKNLSEADVIARVGSLFTADQKKSGRIIRNHAKQKFSPPTNPAGMQIEVKSMSQSDKIQLFEDKRIRTAWDEEKEEWYFSIVDVVAVLTDQPDQRGASNYWAKLKQRLKEEGAEQLLTICQQLKMKSPKDGKHYNIP